MSLTCDHTLSTVDRGGRPVSPHRDVRAQIEQAHQHQESP